MEQENERADLLYGVPSIASFLGLTTAAVYHLTRNGSLPSFRIGSTTICARRSTLNQWLADQEAKARTAETAGK